MKRTAWIVATITMGLVFSVNATSAMALTWYSSSSPLTVRDDGKPQGYAYGNFYNDNGSYAASKAWRKDARPGGDGVYVQTDFYSWEWRRNLDVMKYEWVYRGKKQTSRHKKRVYAAQTVKRALSERSDRARGVMKICEDQSWSRDPCSVKTIRTFDY